MFFLVIVFGFGFWWWDGCVGCYGIVLVFGGGVIVFWYIGLYVGFVFECI